MDFYEFNELLRRLKLNHQPQPTSVSYTGVILHEFEQKRLLGRFARQIPEGWETYGHHMTINLADAEHGPAAEWVGRTVELKVVALGINDLSIAVKVETKVPSNSKIKHITLATSPEGTPKDSNEIQKWSPIDPFKLRGIVQEVEIEGEIPREKVHTPQSAPAPNDPAEFMKIMTGKPDHVIRQALSGKFPNATPEQIEKWMSGHHY
jgi:hypothetical protein